MKKLEDIPKKIIYQVPDGYFDKLPGVVQARISGKEKKVFDTGWGLSLKYALPVLLIMAFGIFWLQRDQAGVEERLSMINEAQIELYLEEADISSEELTESTTWSEEEINALEEDVYSAMEQSADDLPELTEENIEENI